MLKDSKRFQDGGWWGYGMFNYDPASDRFAPDRTGAVRGHVPHQSEGERLRVYRVREAVKPANGDHEFLVRYRTGRVAAAPR
jgi:hypothetical protein